MTPGVSATTSASVSNTPPSLFPTSPSSSPSRRKVVLRGGSPSLPASRDTLFLSQVSVFGGLVFSWGGRDIMD